jgi:hypothetical protein
MPSAVPQPSAASLRDIDLTECFPEGSNGQSVGQFHSRAPKVVGETRKAGHMHTCPAATAWKLVESGVASRVRGPRLVLA